jgi:hypothetical protein
MVDAFAIQENFEVVGSDGDRVGMVDALEGAEIRLSKRDGESGGRSHYLPVDVVERVESAEMRVYLNLTGDEAQALWRAGD